MAGHTGGARPGAGRPRNADKYAAEIASLNDAIAAEVLTIFGKAMELVNGVEVAKPGPNGTTRVYSQPPCAKTIAYLLDRVAGRPTQAVEHSGPDGGAIPLDIAAAIDKVYGTKGED